MSAILAEYTSVFVLRRLPPEATIRACESVRRRARPGEEADLARLASTARGAAVRYIERRARRRAAEGSDGRRPPRARSPMPRGAGASGGLCEAYAEMHVALMRMVGWIMVMVDDRARRAFLMAPVHDQVVRAAARRRAAPRRRPERPEGRRPAAPSEPAIPPRVEGPPTLAEIPAWVEPSPRRVRDTLPRLPRLPRPPR